MSSIADQVRIAQDKDGMLRRALERIIQLYTDRSHFVYELLQNAEDAGATSIKFLQYPDRLEVLHDGKPFTSENLQGLCDIGKSDKVDDLNQIGEFGVGFKSVFGICDTVRLYSHPESYHGNTGNAIPFAVEILDFTRPIDIENEPISRSYTTKFVFPFTVGRTFSGFKTVEELSNTLAGKLQNLGITTLLFMKSLELIEYEIVTEGKPVTGQYLLDKKPINDHCYFVSALGISDAEATSKKGEEEISYLKFTRSIEGKGNRTVDIAFPVSVNADGTYTCQPPRNPYISVYFPTETESKLGFIVQGPYRTTPNRSSVPADDNDNKKLAYVTAELLKESILELKRAGKLNMSFIKALPLSERDFDVYGLFRPVFNAVNALFAREAVFPSKNGKYFMAKYMKIARQEKLASLLPDALLSELINDGNQYAWLPTYLTETNKEYEQVYKYLTSELHVTVIRPEDLRIHFAANPAFLPRRNDNWIVELYGILENVGAAFSKTRYEANMLTADIIKTSKGEFVAAYRRTEGKQYLPNVFLPSKKVKSDDIYFVDAFLYERCRHFFDNILQLKEPDEYEFFIKDFRKRYENGYNLDEKSHIADIRHIIKYLKNDDLCDEVSALVSNYLVLRCNNGTMRNAYSERVFLPVSETGINYEGYLKNIANRVSFVDIEFYSNNGFTTEELKLLGVCNSLLRDENIRQGTYYTGNGGRKPDWWTTGDFRWKMSMECLKDAVKYISTHPTAKDSIIKSKTIFSIVQQNETRLCGTVNIGGVTPNLVNEPCELIKVLRGEKSRDWDGKWLYTESAELVSPKDVTKHDISQAIYGMPRPESSIYDLLGFKKTELDEVAELKKTVPQKQLEAYFETELLQRFGLSSADLAEHFASGGNQIPTEYEHEQKYPFPVANVKNWESLNKHAAEMLVYADPVRYEFAVRRIRVSNRAKEARAYLLNMYKHEGVYKYACQMCHESCSDVERTQIFNNPEMELDPINLCLCPNCASVYRQLRSSNDKMDLFKRQIMKMRDAEVVDNDVVSFAIDGHEIWFTQIHIAEVRALLQLAEDTKRKDHEARISEDSDSNEKEGLSVYSALKGKLLKRKDGFLGEVISVDNDNLTIKVTEGKDAGKQVKVQLSFFIQKPGVYQVIEK